MLRALGGKTNALTLAALLLGVLLTGLNIRQLRQAQSDFLAAAKRADAGGGGDDAGSLSRLKYTVYGKNIDSGYLKHVYSVLERAGFARTNYNTSSEWSLLWAHDYPFKKIRPVLMKMKKWQRVNKLPGSGFVTNKVNLATSGLESIPKAFKIPEEADKLREYAGANPDKMFVQKNKNHRGIKIESLANLDLKSSGSFVQEFVDDPLLIDGYKFDIGVYTMITSIDPLRIYVFEGDVLLRFCPEKYEPFDVKNRDKYVVHDDYRPTWKVPTLAKLYSDLGYSFRETLNAHIRSTGRDPEPVWRKMYDVIRQVYRKKEKEFANAIKNYPHKRVFFEMVRFDFVLDSRLNVYLMEANMSPNLSSKHFPPNRLLYEQVMHSLLRLVGVLRGGVQSSSLAWPAPSAETRDPAAEMQLADKDVHVFADECASEQCSSAAACEDAKCQLCKRCLDEDELEYLKLAFLEHTNRHMCRRVFPEPVTRQQAAGWAERTSAAQARDERKANVKMEQWFAGKCLMDRNWCD